MAQAVHRVDLTNTQFPLISSGMGRSVVVSSLKEAPSGEKVNTPNLYYCHNVMPTDRGIVSVGYSEVIPAPGTNTTFDDVRVIFGTLGNRIHLAITTDGDFYSLEDGDVAWRNLTAPAASAGKLVTVGTVNGVSYIYIQGVGGYKYDEATHNFSAALVFLGLAGTIIGMTASYGYLVAYTSFAVAWSSLVDPLDLVPSATTGAGGGNVSDIEGKIIFIVSNSLGLLIYTAANVVAATYTGNKQYPFKFKSVDNSKGALGLDQVAYEANSSDHFAYTKGGLQTVNSRVSKNVLPEVTDFLAGKQLEDFNEATYVFSTTNLTTEMKKKIKLIASRYLVISYGITTFTHALIYDVVLEKLGKLKITHTDCFEYLGAQVEISKESLAFIDTNGRVQVLKVSVPSTGRSGIAIIGKYQYVRDRVITLHKILVENVASTDSFSCRDLVALDGLNLSVVTPLEVISTGFRSYALRSVGINHSVVFNGAFNLSTIELTFAVGGKR